MKFKVGDKVKTQQGVGEVLFVKDDVLLPYLVGVKGFKKGHNGNSLLPEEIENVIKEKGYVNQCWYYSACELELINEEEEVKMEFKVGDKVKTEEGVGEVLFVKDDVLLPYLVGVKGFKKGHNGNDDVPDEIKKIIEGEGYTNHCWYCNSCDMELTTESDKVNHPSHYNQGNREVIEEMRLLFGDEQVKSFCRLNAYKYKMRADFKGSKEEDLKKAEWYLDYLERM